jgi:exportin-1
MGGTPNFMQTLLNCSQMHAQIYPEVLSNLRESYLDLMARPKEVLVVVDENGEAVEQNDIDVEALYIYEQMRETLIFLTNIDTEGMDKAIQSRLERITTDKDYFSFDRLNKLCWALGSISGTMKAEEENHFIV